MDPLAKALPPAAQALGLSGNYHDFDGLGKLKGQARMDAQGAKHEVAQQFEALFIQMMLKSMREASFKSEFNESSGKETFEAMFDKEVSIAMARRNSLGLANWLLGHMPDSAAPSTAERLLARPGASMPLQAAPAAGLSLQATPSPVLPLPRSGAAMPLKVLRYE